MLVRTVPNFDYAYRSILSMAFLKTVSLKGLGNSQENYLKLLAVTCLCKCHGVPSLQWEIGFDVPLDKLIQTYKIAIVEVLVTSLVND